MQEPEDEAKFDAFFDGAWDRLQSQAFVLTGSQEQAQDLTQETFLRAWSHWRTVAVYDDPEGWTRRVLHNLQFSPGASLTEPPTSMKSPAMPRSPNTMTRSPRPCDPSLATRLERCSSTTASG